MGADIVVTGRTADSALALAPCIHQLKWSFDDFDKMAAGSLAGHLIECGGQVLFLIPGSKATFNAASGGETDF